ncbi:hypothetical protein ACS0TY_014102 [Phlomoides rotata]
MAINSMADSRVSTEPIGLQAGIISRIRLENFMCHSNHEIEFCDWVNFITGQNGSGKSAILTALCVAFGCRARGTQRANTMKDFIKSGCRFVFMFRYLNKLKDGHALVQVEIKNKGKDVFCPELYGDVIIVEHRISESTSSITLKNSQGYIHLVSIPIYIYFDFLYHKMLNISIDWCVAAIMKM